MVVVGGGGKRGLLQAERAEQSVLELLGQRAPADLLGDQTQQCVVGVAVLVGRVGRELRRVPERDVQHLLRCPDLRRVGIQGRRELGRVRVAVEPAAHLQQLGDGDVLAVGHVRNVVGHRVAELELAVLGEQHDQRRSHGLGVRGDPEMGVRSGGVCAPSSVVPTTASKVPCGVRSSTTAPGTKPVSVEHPVAMIGV